MITEEKERKMRLCKICLGCGKRCRVPVEASPLVTGSQVVTRKPTKKEAELLKTYLEYATFSTYF
jgi:hypothetical protein